MNVKRCFGLAVVAWLAAAFLAAAPAIAATRWIRLRSANFVVEGDAGEREIRDVAKRLEEFREMLSRGLPNARFDRTPTLVVVFANEHGYGPVRPRFQGKPVEAAGFFQPGPDVNYVAMVLGGQDPFPIVFHEFTHVFVHANLGEAPLWFEEGLADYYSTFSMTDARHGYIGKMIPWYVQLLRDRWVPLDQILTTVHASPLYNNSDNREVFYAESWAWVHYLLLGSPNNARRPQLFNFLSRLAAGKGREEACVEAFGKPIAGMEKELRQYVQQVAFMSGVMTFDEPITSRISAPVQPLSQAAAEARVGDLLMHGNRVDEAESRLQNALRLDPKDELAHLSLGRLRFRQQKDAEGVKYLEQAVAIDPNSYDAQMAYAEALARRGNAPAPDAVKAAREAYAKALAIRPDSVDAMTGVAWTLLLANEQLDEARRLAERATAADPKDHDALLLLAQLHAAQRDFAGARNLLGPLLASPRIEVRERAREVMARLASYEKMTTWTPNDGVPGSGNPSTPDATTAGGVPAATYRLDLRRVKDGEQRVFGTLERIECAPGGAITFHVKTADGTLRLGTAKFDGVEFVTYRDDLKGNVGCGVRTPPDPVYATFRPSKATAGGEPAPSDGEAVALEFVPRDYRPK